MGQYRLWLQHREIDQLLRAQLKTLVNELAQVDERIRLLANSTLQADNMIIQALLKELQVEASSGPVPNSAPPAPASTENFLSPKMQKFVATYSSTPPQTKITRKFPDSISSAPQISSDPVGPVDQQRIRVNQEVARWFERRAYLLQGSSSKQEANQVIPIDETMSLQKSVSSNTFNALFTWLNPDHIEQFYQSYQSWILQQQRVALLTEIATLQRKVMEHAEQMQRVAPSALALASLTQLQACGVEDIDLLESMLERGEAWLDHTMQLLGRCEQLDIIGSNYTRWCEYALEGAYDWIASVGEDTDEISTIPSEVEEADLNTIEDTSTQITEELLLQKLMSDNQVFNETEEVPVVNVSRITQPLSTQEVVSSGNE